MFAHILTLRTLKHFERPNDAYQKAQCKKEDKKSTSDFQAVLAPNLLP